MAWVDAVRKYAEMSGGKYTIPKKGSEAYAAIKAIQAGESPTVEKKAKVKAVKEPTDLQVARSVVKQGILKKSEVFGRKTRADKGVAKSVKVPRGLIEATAEGVTVTKKRKVRSDKGKKRGPRKAKEESE